MNTIGWILIVYASASVTDFEVWGGYQNQDSCERSRAMLDVRYDKKRQPIRTLCQPVMATQLQS